MANVKVKLVLMVGDTLRITLLMQPLMKSLKKLKLKPKLTPTTINFSIRFFNMDQIQNDGFTGPSQTVNSTCHNANPFDFAFCCILTVCSCLCLMELFKNGTH